MIICDRTGTMVNRIMWLIRYTFVYVRMEHLPQAYAYVVESSLKHLQSLVKTAGVHCHSITVSPYSSSHRVIYVPKNTHKSSEIYCFICSWCRHTLVSTNQLSYNCQNHERTSGQTKQFISSNLHIFKKTTTAT